MHKLSVNQMVYTLVMKYPRHALVDKQLQCVKNVILGHIKVTVKSYWDHYGK